MKKSCALVVFSLILTACGLEIDGPGDADVKVGQSESYQYDLTENGCATGEHRFDSLDAMCDGLKNDSLNRYCAYSLRYDLFRARCGSRTW